MTDPLASNDPGVQKRRSTRIVQAVPITVTGVDALGQSFKERTTTTAVNCHGCKYQSKHYVPKNTKVTLDIPRPEPAVPARRVTGRVIWVQRPRTVRELFQVGVEFDIAGNVWGIAFPPDDWFPVPDEQPAASTGIEAARKTTTPAQSAVEALQKATEGIAERLETTAVAPSAAHPEQAPDHKIHVVPSPAAAPEEAQVALERHVAKLVTNAKEALDKSLKHEAQSAINDEMTIVRQQLDVQLHDAVEKAIRVSMERVSESEAKKLVQEAAHRTNAIVEEARKASEANVEQIDAKVRQAVEQAVSGAAEQAAREAAQQTAALNLKDAVETAVEKALAEREASMPSLQILSSPEAAQEHIEEWKKNLEETTQSVRQRSLEQSEKDAAISAQRWQAEFEKAVQASSQKMQDRLADLSQAALDRAEQDAVARSASLRDSLDATAAKARATLASLADELAQEKARTESAALDLQKTSESSLEQARREIDELLAARSAALRESLDQTVAQARNSASSLSAELGAERARAENAALQLQTTARSALEQTRREIDELLVARVAEINRRADQAIEQRAQQIDPLIEKTAQKAAERVSSEMDQKVAAKLEETRNAVSQLEQAKQQAAESRESVRVEAQLASDQVARLHDTLREEVLQASEQAQKIQQTVREQAAQASEQAIQEALGRLKQQTAQHPAEVEKVIREVVSQVEAEFEQKATATEHATYEALLKASEWYQKKAHTSMQSSVEKAVEQSTAALRDRAAEVSSMVASELDHYRRTYLEHSQAEIEEAAKELVEQERSKLNETAEMANASFTDQVQRATEESLQRLKQSSRETAEKARSDMEFSREGVLAEFQKSVDERLQNGIEQAKERLHSQLQPLMQAVDGTWQTKQREWIEQLQKSTDESIEQYKARLENASNSWLLASATTLGQHSQAVLDTIAKAAEKRLRDTCRDVLAGMGDTLKERMMGLSSGFAEEQDDDAAPKPATPSKGATPPKK